MKLSELLENRASVSENLRDTENVPLKEDIQEYFNREVIPYTPDAWIDEKKTKVGYEIPFTRYFYKYQTPRASEDLEASFLEVEKSVNERIAHLFE